MTKKTKGSAGNFPEGLLSSVEKPSRYIGGEINAVRKDRRLCKLSVALAFPDIYEVGMSHLGLQILYAVLNREADIVAERIYAPWPDMEKALRQQGIPLSTLESGTPLRNFDIVGFSLQYELSFTNVLAMLDLGGIPRERRERREGDPIVIAGGPCTFNPAPMDDFIDVFAIGEGEEVIMDIARTVIEAKDCGRSRQDTLQALALIEGLFVPSVHTSNERIKKRIITDLNACVFPLEPLAPLMQTVHDRIVLEIARGCTRGCRFCQAGMVWRPVRERSTQLLERMADTMLSTTGQDELSLLSLSSGDYSQIEPLLRTLMDRYCARRIALALPSLRVETLTQNLIEDIRRVRKTSFTLAPEAGTQRLRDVINKGNTEADLLDVTDRVFEAGWKAVKLYFMIGLPGETEEDMEGIVDLSYKVLRKTKRRGQITISLSTFVPKAHTPFQWERQIDLEETSKKQIFLKSRLRHRNIEVRWHDNRMSLLEGLFSRGDERLGALIENAFLLGCRFDGWSDQFRFDLWESAMAAVGIQPSSYLRARNRSEALPWDRIDCGLERQFLTNEADRAGQSELTPDCRFDQCRHCGVCDHYTVKMMIAETPIEDPEARIEPITVTEPDGKPGKRYRLTFTKQGAARYLSHLDVSATLHRAMARGRVAILFSEGFHPHPKISFAFATPVGMESLEEYADIQTESSLEDPEALLKRLNAFLPEGIEITSLLELPDNAPTLSEMIQSFSFSVALPEVFTLGDLDAMKQKVADFLAAQTFTIARTNKGKETTKEIRSFVDILQLDSSSRSLSLKLRFSAQGTARPTDILTQVLGIPADVAVMMKIVKEKTFFKD
jgi:radical SAM family uncharacterized protein/radical SAM-linked protein